MPIARRHHYIPRFYLKGFSTARKQGRRHYVTVHERGGKRYQANIIDVAVETDFNTIDVVGHNPDAFEKGVAAFEGEISGALARLIDYGSFQSEEDKVSVLNFVAATAVRNPRLREVWRDFRERIFYAAMSAYAGNEKLWNNLQSKLDADGTGLANKISREEVMRHIEGRSLRVELPNEDHILREVESVDTVLPYLIGRKWLIVKAPMSSSGFVTSDHPVCLNFNDPATARGPYSPGFGLRDTSVLFPLARRLAMVGTFEGKDESITLNEQGVARVNLTVIAHSVKRVFSPDTSFHYHGLQDGSLKTGASLMRDPRFSPQKVHS